MAAESPTKKLRLYAPGTPKKVVGCRGLAHYLTIDLPVGKDDAMVPVIHGMFLTFAVSFTVSNQIKAYEKKHGTPWREKEGGGTEYLRFASMYEGGVKKHETYKDAFINEAFGKFIPILKDKEEDRVALYEHLHSLLPEKHCGSFVFFGTNQMDKIINDDDGDETFPTFTADLKKIGVVVTGYEAFQIVEA